MTEDGEHVSLGTWMRRRRKALNLTQAALAQRVGCADITIRKLETDAMRPSREIAGRLGVGLQIPPAERELFLQVARGDLPVARLPAPHTGLDVSPPLPAQASPPGGDVPAHPAIHVVRIPQAAPAVILSGQVKDARGQGLAQQHLHLEATDGSVSRSQTTDATGAYRFEVPQGSYRLDLSGSRTSAGQHVPGHYRLSSDAGHAPLTVRANTTLDLVLPFKRLTVHVEDSLGQPVASARIETDHPRIDQLSVGSLALRGHSMYVADDAVTNVAGDVVLWLFPTPPGKSYTLTVTPPAGIPFATSRVPHITVTTDTSMIIILQYD